MLRSVCVLILVLLAGCASGDSLDDSTDDLGRTSGRGRDASADDSSSDRDAPTGRDLGATDSADGFIDDAQSDGSGDAGTDAEPDAEVDVGWQPVESTNPRVSPVVEQSREALVAFCNCCVARFASDPTLCLTTAFDGGFPATRCHLDVFERDATSDGFLDCMNTAYQTLETCNLGCGGGCSLCENNFNFDAVACRNAHPGVVEQLARCTE